MFNGFTPAAIDFLWGIRFNNNRDWFQAHKAEYQAIPSSCRAALPHMRAQGSGSIVNLSAIAGVYGNAGVSYSAAKAAVINSIFLLESRRYNVRIRHQVIRNGSIVSFLWIICGAILAPEEPRYSLGGSGGIVGFSAGEP